MSLGPCLKFGDKSMTSLLNFANLTRSKNLRLRKTTESRRKSPRS